VNEKPIYRVNNNIKFLREIIPRKDDEEKEAYLSWSLFLSPLEKDEAKHLKETT
jgi:hypothetical protein